MSFVAAATVAVVGAGAYQQNKGERRAGDIQAGAAQAGIDENNMQLDEIKKLFMPFISAGNSTLTRQLDLLGVNGNDAETAAIESIKSGSTFKEMLKQGETSILQNASATGGLRGGNTQAALTQFSPDLLNKLIQERFSSLGGITTLGQNTAVNEAATRTQVAENISELLSNKGAAKAGGAISKGNMFGDITGSIAGGLGGLF